MDTNLISSLIDEKVFGVWFLIGAALVFWMQAGFAMVECGFWVSRTSISSQITQALTGQTSYSTLFSVPQQQLSYQVLWQRELSLSLIAYIQLLSQLSFILSKLTGHGAAAGFHRSDSTILQVLTVSTW